MFFYQHINYTNFYVYSQDCSTSMLKFLRLELMRFRIHGLVSVLVLVLMHNFQS